MADNFKNINDRILLNSMMASTNDAIVFTNREGIIIKMSKAYSTYLNKSLDECIGKHVIDVIQNTRMHKVMETGVAEIAQLQEINGRTMIATRIPIKHNGKIIGAFGRVVFKDLRELSSMHESILELQNNLNAYRDKFESLSSSHYSIDDIIGKSDIIINTKSVVRKFAKGKSNVLILGETGTGKELFAHAIHALSERRNKPFLSINCASIPSELIESEFFGYVDGAFTGSRRGGKLGLFHAADKGTLFLDEIGDLPLYMQVKLLRALQEKEIRRIGANFNEKIDVRIIAATNKKLIDMVNANKFREDLYYRLNVVSITIPPLRERLEDIPLLVKELLFRISSKNGILIEGIDDDAIKLLQTYNWPGNIREMENVIERSSNFLDKDRIIHKEHIYLNSDDNLHVEFTGKLSEIVNRAEKTAIKNSLEANGGNKSKTARALGLSRTSLYEKMRKHNIK